jgi:hypothetical protein
MGSTVCVRCGATLVPLSYCSVCHSVLCFTCSSCSMNTDERIHAYCHNTGTRNDNNGSYFPVQTLSSTSLIIDGGDDDHSTNTHNHIRNKLNHEMEYDSINLSRKYWDSIFEYLKLVNRYWFGLFNIGNSNSTIT